MSDCGKSSHPQASRNGPAAKRCVYRIELTHSYLRESFGPLKLLTLNTHSWLEIHQLHKIKRLADFILAEEIDVVALQEVNQNVVSDEADAPSSFLPVRSQPLKKSNFALLLSAMLEKAGAAYQWSWADSHVGWGIYDEGISLLSRLPVQQVQCIETSKNIYTYDDVFRRCALAFEVETASGSAWFASAHMNWWLMEGEYLFEHDFASLNQQLRSLAGEKPVFLMGDFNNCASIPDEGYAQMMRLNWHDSFAQAQQRQGEFTVHKNIAGWEGATKAMRLDYILTSQPIPCLSHRVVFDDSTEDAISDHSGVVAEYDFE